MSITSDKLSSEIVYPISDGALTAESDSTRDYLIYAVESPDIYSI